MFLGRVIEKVSGLKYIEFIQKYIMEPIGVKDFKLAGDYRKDRSAKEVTYYPLEFKSSPYSIKVGRSDSAFGLCISPRECVKFGYHWMRHATASAAESTEPKQSSTTRGETTNVQSS